MEKPVVHRVTGDHSQGGCLGCDRQAQEMAYRDWSPTRPVTVIELGNLRVRVCDRCTLSLAEDLTEILKEILEEVRKRK